MKVDVSVCPSVRTEHVWSCYTVLYISTCTYYPSITCSFYKISTENVSISNSDIVGTVYHLVIYIQSNKIHKVF